MSTILDLESEPLHDDLRGFVRSTPLLGQVLHSPWIVTPGVDLKAANRPNALANRVYLQARDDISRAVEAGEYEHAITLTTRPYRDEMFDLLRERLTDVDYWRLLAFVWTDAENPEEDPDSRFASWFASDRAGRENLMTPAEQEAYQALPSELTLYRGAPPSAEAGLAWSLQRSVAEFFARRYPAEATTIFQRTVPKAHTLALFTSRGEAEVIVHPDYWRTQ